MPYVRKQQTASLVQRATSDSFARSRGHYKAKRSREEVKRIEGMGPHARTHTFFDSLFLHFSFHITSTGVVRDTRVESGCKVRVISREKYFPPIHPLCLDLPLLTPYCFYLSWFPLSCRSLLMLLCLTHCKRVRSRNRAK